MFEEIKETARQDLEPLLRSGTILWRERISYIWFVYFSLCLFCMKISEPATPLRSNPQSIYKYVGSELPTKHNKTFLTASSKYNSNQQKVRAQKYQGNKGNNDYMTDYCSSDTIGQSRYYNTDSFTSFM